MWYKHWPETIYVGQWPMFHGPVIVEDWWTKCHNWNIGSMWCKDLPHKIYVGQWSTFHGPVILSYILKTFCWRNVVLKILIQFDQPIFCGSVILPYIVNTICWTSLIFLEIGWVWYGPLTCISWVSNFESFYLFLPIVVCWSLIWIYLWM